MLSVAEKRALGGLLLSCAGTGQASLGMRPLGWYNSLARLGIAAPLFVVRDLGSALLGTVSTFASQSQALNMSVLGLSDVQRQGLLATYAHLLTDVSGTDVAAQLRKAN